MDKTTKRFIDLLEHDIRQDAEDYTCPTCKGSGATSLSVFDHQIPNDFEPRLCILCNGRGTVNIIRTVFLKKLIKQLKEEMGANDGL